MSVIKIGLRVVALVLIAFTWVSKNMDLMVYVFGLLALLFIIMGYEEIKMKKNLGNGLTLFSVVVIMTLFLIFSYI